MGSALWGGSLIWGRSSGQSLFSCPHVVWIEVHLGGCTHLSAKTDSSAKVSGGARGGGGRVLAGHIMGWCAPLLDPSLTEDFLCPGGAIPRSTRRNLWLLCLPLNQGLGPMLVS